MIKQPPHPPKGTWPDSPIRAFVRAIGLLDRLSQPFFGKFGISRAQWGVLITLMRAEWEGKEGLRLNELGEHLLVRPPSVTGIVDRLERAGLVARGASAGDARAKTVRLTDKGRAVCEEVKAVHAAHLDLLLGGLKPADKTELLRLLNVWGDHLQRLVDSDRSAGGG